MPLTAARRPAHLSALLGEDPWQEGGADCRPHTGFQLGASLWAALGLQLRAPDLPTPEARGPWIQWPRGQGPWGQGARGPRSH